MASEEVTGDIRAVYLEALGLAAVLMGQSHVMEHRACIKQFGIESEPTALACQSAPVIDAARMVKEQRRFVVPHHLHDFARELAVGNSDSREIDIHCNIDIHWNVSCQLAHAGLFSCGGQCRRSGNQPELDWNKMFSSSASMLILYCFLRYQTHVDE